MTQDKDVRIAEERKALEDALRGLLKAYENAFDWTVELPPETVEAEHIANEVLHALTSSKPEQVVTEAMVEALRNIDAEAPAKEPRDDWTSTDLDEAFYEGKLRGFWEMAVYAREALTAALGAQTPPEQAVTEAMVEAAANSIANIWCTGDLKAIARAALKAAMGAGG